MGFGARLAWMRTCTALLAVLLGACSAAARPTDAYATRELALGPEGALRVAIGDPRLPDGGWASAEVLEGELTITELEAVAFRDADGDGEVDAGEARASMSQAEAGALVKRVWLRLDTRLPGEGSDAVCVRVGTSQGDASVVIPLEP